MKNKITKTAIFGGSFDPPHFGHIDIVKNLEKRFDKVIVVPSFVSPFKTGASDASARLRLCKKVFASDTTEVSRYEVAKKGVSYSVDTAAYYAKKSDGALYWVIGSEELYRLCDWHDIDRLKTLVTFYVVNRPNFAPSDSLLKDLKKRKIKIKFANFDGLDISSARIKIDKAFGMPNAFVPSDVRAFADKNGLFDPYSDYVRGLYSHGLRYDRILHIYRTALRGAYLAKKYGASVDKAVTACILHDIAKADDDAGKYKNVVDLSGFPPPTMHSPIGAYIAKREYGVPDDVAHAIAVHTTACEDMSVLDEVVYLADKTEDGRKYASLELMRYLCDYDKNIAMLAALKEIKKLSASEACAMSDDAIAYYELVCGDAEIPQLPPREQSQPSGKNLPVLGEVKSKSVGLVRQAKSKAVAPVAGKDVATVPEKNTDLSVVLREHCESMFVSSGDAIKDIALAAADALNAHKAHDIKIVGLDGKTIVADYFVIASATSTTAVKALMGYVEDRLKKQFNIDPAKRDVDKEWIALDYGGVIIHIFIDKTREFYNIERLWSDGSNVERFGD